MAHNESLPMSVITRANVVIATVLDSMKELIALVVNTASDVAKSITSNVARLLLRCRRWLKLLPKQAVNICSSHILEIQRGQLYNNMRFSLGNTTYKNLKLDPGITLVKVSYCQCSWSGLLGRMTESFPQVDSIFE